MATERNPGPDWDPGRADQIISGHCGVKGGLIEALHALQAEFGYIDEAAYETLAKAFNLSRAEVYGVVSFYHDFRDRPAGHKVVKLCQAEACQAMGSRKLTAAVKDFLGVDFGETTCDGAVTLEAVYCLGNCATPPSVMIDDRVYGRMTAERFSRLVRGRPS
ncbi:formate dehydrogenase subunit gamma [Luteithermobacter gelatinilyticus]|uniref:formate dehydrogenase subunit gamma n=1 Tax=Luteithermobacter gelatinilyticus TaxID=2582913 RepID=UPI001105E3CA|nr:formate dehydrogenase subunit gamma [Luteithermobacter gelatinilyticus]